MQHPCVFAALFEFEPPSRLANIDADRRGCSQRGCGGLTESNVKRRCPEGTSVNGATNPQDSTAAQAHDVSSFKPTPIVQPQRWNVATISLSLSESQWARLLHAHSASTDKKRKCPQIGAMNSCDLSQSIARCCQSVGPVALGRERIPKP